MSNKNGCETMNKLWNVALECNIEQPGIYGVSDRVSGFIQCKNVKKNEHKIKILHHFHQQ